ncbi:MAG: nuclear transport factor 2 family protein [Promethearchaeota archaeon]
MNEYQNKEKIIKLAEQLDIDLELQDIDRLIPYFSEDCEIEIFGLKIKGKQNLKKWLNWFFEMFDTIKFEPITIMVDNYIFFEEFYIEVSFQEGKRLRVKVAEVLEYQNYKITCLRLYFDRLEFADVIANGFLSKKIIKAIKKRSLKGLI